MGEIQQDIGRINSSTNKIFFMYNVYLYNGVSLCSSDITIGDAFISQLDQRNPLERKPDET